MDRRPRAAARMASTGATALGATPSEGPDATPRRAVVSEARALSELARRSKAHHGYTADFIERHREELTISAADILAHEVWVLDSPEGAIVGFYRLIPGEPAILEDLWIEPGSIGAGHGRRLWRHALSTARSAGATAVELDADPHAIGFYERMGAVRVGWSASSEPGRVLPRMRASLGPSG